MAEKLRIPTVTSEDLLDYQARHFSGLEARHEQLRSGQPSIADAQTTSSVVDDDDLGYYPDGAKRTLTDDQIAIFRHSEVQALLREKRRVEEARDGNDMSLPTPDTLFHNDEGIVQGDGPRYAIVYEEDQEPDFEQNKRRKRYQNTGLGLEVFENTRRPETSQTELDGVNTLEYSNNTRAALPPARLDINGSASSHAQGRKVVSYEDEIDGSESIPPPKEGGRFGEAQQPRFQWPQIGE